MIKNHITNILLVLVVILLSVILLQGKIRAYFKAQEVLNKANVFNIMNVANYCHAIFYSSAEISPECQSKLNEYSPKIKKWEAMIRKNRDINCKEFDSKTETQDFFQYINGDLARVYYAQPKTSGFDPEVWGVAAPKDFHCTYDPYGLDTNGDCNACESYE